jgi:hypothetical protein
MIDPVLRPSATPIAPFDLRAALSSSKRLSSSGLHGLLLFFGMVPVIERGLRRQPYEGAPVPSMTALYEIFFGGLPEEPVEPTPVTSGSYQTRRNKRWTGTGLKEIGKRRRAK